MKKKPIINNSTNFKISPINIIRLSFGDLNKKIIYFFFKKFFQKKIKPKIINFSYFYNLKNVTLDKCIILYFNKPKSYTGEDLIEIHSHGNIYLIKNIIKNCFIFLKKYHIRFSKRGEFSKRGFENEKIDIFNLSKIFILLKKTPLNLLKKNRIFFNLDLKKIALRINYILEKIDILNNLLINFSELKKKNLITLINILKKNIFFFIKKSFIFNNIKKNFLIIFGIINVGKSTFINSISKKNFSIISSLKGTTKDNILRKIKIKNNIYKIVDTPGIDGGNSIIDFIGILFSIKKIKFSNYLIYISDNPLYYNYYYYYIKFNILKKQTFIKIFNKIDVINDFSSLEFLIKKNIKLINLKISSKLKLGLYFFKNEINRNRNSFYNLKNFNNIIFKFLKKCYTKIFKILFFLKSNNFFLFLKNFSKIKKILYILLNKKNKNFLNKIFNSFCIGK
ncbi:MAG: GTPase [Candidatus Nasuia deltocephalinicola]